MAYKEVSIWWRIARFTSDSGQFLQAEITYGTYPSSILSTYESCANFLCWETEWESAPVTRTAAEAASINQLMSEKSHCAVAANERSESATGFKRSQSQSHLPAGEDKSATPWLEHFYTSAETQPNVQISRILSKIDSRRFSHFVINWPRSTGVPLLYAADISTGQACYGQADNFCEICDVISPEMLYFYSTSDEEF